MIPIELIAHRGASQDAPENTLAAIEMAWQQNADGIEIDIHRCKSGEIVVIHDPNALRTTGFDGEIREMTLAQLKQLDAGTWKGAQFAGERIPTLDEVLARLPSDKRIFIEIKTDDGIEAAKAILAPLKTALKGAQLRDEQIAFICFKLEVLQAAKPIFPQLEMSWIRGPWGLRQIEDGDVSRALIGVIESCREAGIEGLNLMNGWVTEDADVERVQQAGLALYANVMNRRHLLPYVKGFMTDCPAETRALLES